MLSLSSIWQNNFRDALNFVSHFKQTHIGSNYGYSSFMQTEELLQNSNSQVHIQKNGPNNYIQNCQCMFVSMFVFK